MIGRKFRCKAEPRYTYKIIYVNLIRLTYTCSYTHEFYGDGIFNELDISDLKKNLNNKKWYYINEIEINMYIKLINLFR